MKFRKMKTGSSLLISLLALVLVTMVATKIFTNVDNQSKILSTSIRQDSILAYLQAGEAWAEQMLLEDTLEFDSETKIMSTEFELDEGKLFIKLIDLQSCLNINVLAEESLKEKMRAYLQTLSSVLSVDNVWVDIVTDWVDQDDDVTGYGKESFDYLSNDPAYKAANTMLISDYEWNMLDISEEELEEIIPYICALPTVENKININTVNELLLKSIHPNITDSQIAYIERLVEEGSIESLESLKTDSVISSLNWSENDWSIETHYIGVLVNLQMQGKTYWLHSEIAKNTNDIVKAYFRSTIEPNAIVKARFLYKGTAE